MPYLQRRIPAIVAIAYVQRVDKCERAAAVRQIEAAVFDGALRFVRPGNDQRWGWDAGLFLTDLLRLWPKPPTDGDSPLRLGEAAAAPLRYVSRRERWRRLYRTLPEWVEIVQAASNCDASAAQNQILDGLCDRAFAVRWEEDDRSPVDWEFAGGPPPWREANIDWKTGRVYCDRGLPAKGRLACLARWLTPLLVPSGPSIFERMLADHREVNVSSPAPTPNAAERGADQGRRGRKKGSGSKDDTENLRAMLRLLAVGQAHSVHEAANKVAESISESSQSRSADVARLRRKFANAYGTEPPVGKTWADVERELNAN